MKIIGEKLNEKEMLSIQGGFSCMVCRCNGGCGCQGPWYSMEESVSVAEALHEDDCGTAGVTCSWGPGGGNCPAIQE